MNRPRFIPGPRLALLLLPSLPLFLLGERGALLGFAFDAFLLALAWLDALPLAKRVPAVERVIEHRVLLGVPQRVLLKLHNSSGVRVRGTLRDAHPPQLRVDTAELRFDLPPHARRVVSYELRGERRGAFAF